MLGVASYGSIEEAAKDASATTTSERKASWLTITAALLATMGLVLSTAGASTSWKTTARSTAETASLGSSDGSVWLGNAVSPACGADCLLVPVGASQCPSNLEQVPACTDAGNYELCVGECSDTPSNATAQCGGRFGHPRVRVYRKTCGSCSPDCALLLNPGFTGCEMSPKKMKNDDIAWCAPANASRPGTPLAPFETCVATSDRDCGTILDPNCDNSTTYLNACSASQLVTQCPGSKCVLIPYFLGACGVSVTSNPWNLTRCKDMDDVEGTVDPVTVGGRPLASTQCIADGECGTAAINNCDGFNVYEWSC